MRKRDDKKIYHRPPFYNKIDQSDCMQNFPKHTFRGVNGTTLRRLSVIVRQRKACSTRASVSSSSSGRTIVRNTTAGCHRSIWHHISLMNTTGDSLHQGHLAYQCHPLLGRHCQLLLWHHSHLLGHHFQQLLRHHFQLLLTCHLHLLCQHFHLLIRCHFHRLDEFL